MSFAKTALGSFAAGAALMYFTDPNRGKRRRAVVRDRVSAGFRDAARELEKAKRDLRNRSQGLASAVRHFGSDEHADDSVIEERVRSAMGRVMRHPHGIQVSVEEGRVTLEGQVNAQYLAELLHRVQSVAGVRDVVNRLNTRGLQRNPAEARESWAPAIRAGAAALGATALVGSRFADGFPRMAATVAGSALLARAVANRGLRDIVGVGGKRTVRLEKSLQILAPVEEVFAFWSHVENFPRFMTHLKEVRDLGGGRSHWVAEGPGGVAVSWDAEITDYKKNEMLAWRSINGSTVNTEGVVKFSKSRDGGTTVQIRMCYCPPAGVLGHGVAWLFGADPKSEMDDDLARLKSLLEIGKTRARGSAVRREEFAAT